MKQVIKSFFTGLIVAMIISMFLGALPASVFLIIKSFTSVGWRAILWFLLGLIELCCSVFMLCAIGLSVEDD